MPAACELAWGKTSECENSAYLEVNHFGSYSLTGLEPDQKYSYRVKFLRIPEKKTDMIHVITNKMSGYLIKRDIGLQPEAFEGFHFKGKPARQ